MCVAALHFFNLLNRILEKLRLGRWQFGAETVGVDSAARTRICAYARWETWHLGNVDRKSQGTHFPRAFQRNVRNVPQYVFYDENGPRNVAFEISLFEISKDTFQAVRVSRAWSGITSG